MKLNVQNATLRMTAGDARQFPGDPIPHAAFSGRSNVGKSSLINTLMGRKSFARVSSSPGKTITVNFYDIDKQLFLVDLPGYGYAKRTFEEKKKWSALVDGFFTNNRNIDRLRLVVQLVDARIGPTRDDEDMLDFLVQTEMPFIVVATKVDKLNATERRKNLEALRAHPLVAEASAVIPFSALKGEGKDDVWKAILEHCFPGR